LTTNGVGKVLLLLLLLLLTAELPPGYPQHASPATTFRARFSPDDRFQNLVRTRLTPPATLHINKYLHLLSQTRRDIAACALHCHGQGRNSLDSNKNEQPQRFCFFLQPTKQ
ncbi:unnamed protein product, partial [Ectocarpus sp. 4 AP-2014]